MAEGDAKEAKGKTVSKPKRAGYYLVNPAGAIHQVEREEARRYLREPGFRMATEAEIEAYHAAGMNQRFDRPLATPFEPAPEPDPQLEAR